MGTSDDIDFGGRKRSEICRRQFCDEVLCFCREFFLFVALVALGGVACTLGGATLGSIALAGSPTSHLTAGLLMTGVGIVLVTISGVAWRMTTSDTHQCTGRCGRRQCSRGNSSFGLLYPEFQHRPPPPSYQASMQEHRLRVMMLDRERQTTSNTRASPPPTYRSNTGTLLRPPIHFQRQNQQQQQHQNASSNNIVQVEIPIDESTLINDANVSNSSTNNATEYVHTNQSPTSSQTITTIASINRPDDNDIADVTSLIRINEMTRVQHENETEESNSSSSRCRINYVSSSNSSSSSSNSSNSSRCNNDRHNTLCNNKITLDHHRHHMINNENIIVIDDKCKNVNIGNMMEINKALMSNSHHTMTLPRCTQQRASFLNRENCELGVR
ncbi:hypothetical protein PVAND_000887 [Polypedilum vanderplanki]|uniref:Uncharacterized protein n=1 Tax=Polypedilum vanderplanki TaxID=319348 RepID=A0A9J6BLW7_POLVA|nr:hypothetical protein PVAND_000887 [Polypedilum vanderplanki]